MFEDISIYWSTKKNFHQWILQDGDCRVILPKHVEFEALYGTQCSWCKFESV